MLLGWVGRKLNEKDLCNLSLSRIGGQPVWLQPTQSAEQQMLTCELCQGNLVLVGQFAAGYDAMPQRLLHIFACSACSSDSRAWRVYRSVRETTVDPTQAQDQGQDTDHISQKSTLAVDSTTGSDDWGVHPDNWGVTDDTDWGAQPVATAALDAEIDALLQARATQGAQAPSVGSQQQKAPKKKMESPQQDEMSWTGTCDKCLKETWPCHVIDVDCEPAANPKSGEHERELLERYLQSDLAKEDADAVLPASALPPEVAEQLRMENDPRIRILMVAKSTKSLMMTMMMTTTTQDVIMERDGYPSSTGSQNSNGELNVARHKSFGMHGEELLCGWHHHHLSLRMAYGRLSVRSVDAHGYLSSNCYQPCCHKCAMPTQMTRLCPRWNGALLLYIRVPRTV